MADESIREALEAAYDEAEAKEGGRPEADAAQPVRAEAQPKESDERQSKPTARDDGRDEHGRFAPKTASSLAEAKADDKPGADSDQRGSDGKPAAVGDSAPAAKPQPVDQYGKAPASWKPAAREHWAQLPPDVRGEIYRRESEASRVMQETTEARHAHHALSTLSQKYAATMAAEGGVDILTATDNLAQVATRLRFGAPPEKAHQIAALIKAYGVDITTLDNILAGLPAQPAAMQQQQFRDPRVDQMLQEAQAAQRQREEQLARQSAAEVERFGEGKEFFGDVRGIMADMIEVSARQGFELSLQDAYDRAVQLHPEIGKVLSQRAQAEAARNPNRSTARSRAAASSVKGSPAGGPSRQAGGSIRDDILSSMEQVGGR